MIFAAVIAAAAALIGAAVASGDNARAAAIRQGVADKYHDLPLPLLDKAVAQKLPPDAAERYLKSTQATQAQGDVLAKMMGEVNAKGETPEDRAAYLRMQQEAGSIANGAQSAVKRDMEARGMGGSGMSFALQQQGAQAGAARANELGIREAADARGRYAQALASAGQLSGQMRSQQLQALSAQDSINEFNARQQSDANYYNLRLPQQQFENRKSLLDSEANALNGVAAGMDRSADATRQAAGGIGQSVITAGAAYDQYGNPIKKPRDQGSSDASGGQDW